MSLADLIRGKSGPVGVATATVATPATVGEGNLPSVATVASVAVADSPNAKSGTPLLDALEVACRGLPVTPGFVQSALAPEDKADWERGDLSLDTLRTFAQTLVWDQERAQGKAPAHYAKRALCRQCGPIWLWTEGTFVSCPW